MDTLYGNKIGIPSSIEHIEWSMKWFGELYRLQHDLPGAQTYNSWHPRQRSRGRSRNRWIDCVKERCYNHNFGIRDTTTLAYSRTLPTTLGEARLSPRAITQRLWIAYGIGGDDDDNYERRYSRQIVICDDVLMHIERMNASKVS
jgi:hypothetical protein